MKKIAILVLSILLSASTTLATEIKVTGEISGSVYVNGVLIKVLTAAPCPQPIPCPPCPQPPPCPTCPVCPACPDPQPTPTPPPQPPGTFPWGSRITTGISAGGEISYTAVVSSPTNTILQIQVIGMTNNTNVYFTWTFPDGKVFDGVAQNTSINGLIYLRSRLGFSPNLMGYDYIPMGNHIFKLRGISDSSLVIRGTTY